MSSSFRSAFVALVAVSSVACGSSLDLGSDALPGCKGTPSAPVTLTAFAELPEFYPSSVAIVGDDAYVGGVDVPASGITSDTIGIGRLYRVPLRGGAPVEVWRGDSFRAPLKVHDARIYFAELDVTNQLAKPVYGGIDVYDTKTGMASRIANLPGRDFVIDFAIGAEGVVFSAGSLLGAGKPETGYSIARSVGGETVSLFTHPKRSASFFLRDDHVIAQMTADGTESGYADDDEGDRHAVYTIGPTGITLERRFEELPAPTSFAGQVTYLVLGGDASSYYVAARTTGQGVSTQRVARTRTGNTFGETVVPASVGWPTLYDGRAYFTPSVDRSMIRTRATASPISEGDSEVVFDPRRQVNAFALDACRVVWLSESNTEPQKKRIVLGPRK